jgi:hypothetical protein
MILQINFYSNQERLVSLGEDDDYVERYTGRVESVNILGDEQLIGCQLYADEERFRGVTWIKRIVPSNRAPTVGRETMKTLKIGVKKKEILVP